MKLLFALLLQGRHGFDIELIQKKALVDQATMGEVLLRLLRFIPSAPFQDKLAHPCKFQIKRTFFQELKTGRKYTFIFLIL